MNYFFLFISLFFSVGIFAGSFGSQGVEKEQVNKQAALKVKEPRTIIQVVPIKGRVRKEQTFLKEQLLKMAIRHISLSDRYEMAFGKVLPKATGKTRIENLEITLIENQSKGNYRLELRIFELERNTLLKKVAQSRLSKGKLLQQAELMFQDLFLESVVIPE